MRAYDSQEIIVKDRLAHGLLMPLILVPVILAGIAFAQPAPSSAGSAPAAPSSLAPAPTGPTGSTPAGQPYPSPIPTAGAASSSTPPAPSGSVLPASAASSTGPPPAQPALSWPPSYAYGGATAPPIQPTTAQSSFGAPRQPAAPPAPLEKQTDHDRIVRRVGIGLFGYQSFFGGDAGTGMPIIGVRYWPKRRIGVEAAAGINVLVIAANERATPVPAFALHAGLPLALGVFDHFTPLVMPYARFGIITNEGPTVVVGEIGARAGAEVQFGFIGIPELALQATVGIGLRYRHVSSQQGLLGLPGAPATDIITLATTVEGEPWDVFLGNVAAVYYF